LCPGKPYCSVRQWILVDLDISDEKKALVTEQGFQPIFLYAHSIDETLARIRADLRDLGLRQPVEGVRKGFGWCCGDSAVGWSNLFVSMP
jgi:hypothetical protein